MEPRLQRHGTRGRLIPISLAVATAVCAAGLRGLLYDRARPAPHHSPVKLGGQAVPQAARQDFLSVVSTDPAAMSPNVAPSNPIRLTFSLPVDPSAVGSSTSILPDVPGSFTQGAGDGDVIFTPSQPFPLGTAVTVVVRKGLRSRDGRVLPDDFSFGFSTVLKPGRVMFESGTSVGARLLSVASGGSAGVTIRFGPGVPASAVLRTYRATPAALVGSFVHRVSGYFDTYLDEPVATASLQPVDGGVPVKDGAGLTLTHPDGIYVAIAEAGGAQYGALWEDFSHYGVLLRQDDQKIVLAGEDLATGDTSPTFKVTFYGLSGSVSTLASGSFSGTGEFAAHYPSGIDLAVASTGGEDVVVPVSAPETNADVKVVGDLGTVPRIFITTDRAAYRRGETVKFAGDARFSNDQGYTIPAGLPLRVWAGDRNHPAVAQRVIVGPDGGFSGSFQIPDALFNQDGSSAQVQLDVDSDTAPLPYGFPFAVIQTLGDQAGPPLTVSFDKASYVASDTIVATIAGGAGAAGKVLSLTVYSTSHSTRPAELDSFPNPTTWGVPAKEGIQAQLDGSGRTTYSFPANLAAKASNQDVTLVASYPDAVASAARTAFGAVPPAAAARTAAVYQARDDVFLLPSRTTFQAGEQVRIPFLVESREGARVPGLAISYEFSSTTYQGTQALTTVLAKGSATTDSAGLATAAAAFDKPVANSLVLSVSGQDAAGNVFQDSRPLSVVSNPHGILFGDDALVHLDVTQDKIAYTAGDSAHLTVHSPFAMTVLLSLERGRVHQYRLLKLGQGDTSVALSIGADLAPGFTAMFSYFHDGAYVNEGMPVAVGNRGRLLRLTLTPQQKAYAPGQTAHLAVAVTDASGTAQAASLLVDAYDAGMSAYKVVDQPSLAEAFLTPAVRATNGSSSLLGIGAYGGRCGGNANPDRPAATRPGSTDAWIPSLATDATGHATVDVPIGQGPVRVVVFAASAGSSWGQLELDLGGS